MIRVQPIPCLKDNYAYIVECTRSGAAALVDASEAGPVLAGIEQHAKGKVKAIWSTHHHPDHVGGNEEVASALGGVPILGHASDRGRIPGQTKFLEEGAKFALGELQVRTLHIPGHTTGAIAYIVEGDADGDAPCVFTGDTLFVAGCGRLFEGTPAMMHESLQKLAKLAPATRVYCGHEYTASNLRFAAHVEPGNADVKNAAARVEKERGAGKATVPGTIGEELKTNPFLRVQSKQIREALGIGAGADDATAFGAIRKAKDEFR
jgi:hydroxyacylglutathione hydrolase